MCCCRSVFIDLIGVDGATVVAVASLGVVIAVLLLLLLLFFVAYAVLVAVDPFVVAGVNVVAVGFSMQLLACCGCC